MAKCAAVPDQPEEIAFMRLTMELSRTPTVQFEGTVVVGALAPITFSGTLELLKVLQDVTQDQGTAERTEQ
jgi:hypothetical protein